MQHFSETRIDHKLDTVTKWHPIAHSNTFLNFQGAADIQYVLYVLHLLNMSGSMLIYFQTFSPIHPLCLARYNR